VIVERNINPAGIAHRPAALEHAAMFVITDPRACGAARRRGKPARALKSARQVRLRTAAWPTRLSRRLDNVSDFIDPRRDGQGARTVETERKLKGEMFVTASSRRRRRGPANLRARLLLSGAAISLSRKSRPLLAPGREGRRVGRVVSVSSGVKLGQKVVIEAIYSASSPSELSGGAPA